MNETIINRIQNLLEQEKYRDCKLVAEIKQAIAEEEKFKLKTIKDLKGIQFYIPRYQRGYRWKPQQVEVLLNDINDYANQTDAKKADFYFLQPVVVMKNEDRWDVIDGQQRLITIFIILQYLKKEKLFDIDYKTRTKSTDFLQNIAANNNNIDQ